MTKQAVQDTFEPYIRHVLQSAVDYVGDDESVRTIWAYCDLSLGGIATMCFFQTDDAFLNATEYAERAGEGRDPEDFDEALTAGPDMDFLKALNADGDVPQRITAAYDVEEGTMSADWEYEGVLDDPDDSGDEALDDWVAAKGGTRIYS